MSKIYFNHQSARRVASLADAIPNHVRTAGNYLERANRVDTPALHNAAERVALEQLNLALAKAKQVVADLEAMIAKGNS